MLISFPRIWRLLLLAGSMLGATQLAACAAMTPLPPSGPVAEPAAEQVEVAHQVHFVTDQAELTAEERARLDAFLSGLPPDARPEFRVIGRADERAGDTYNLDLSTRRAATVASEIRQRVGRGPVVRTVALRELAPLDGRPGEGALALNRSVEVVATTYTVRLPECPDWSRDPAFDPQNLPLSNLGCANAVNLGLMVADPGDLARGREVGPADGIREAEAIVRYRTDKVKALQAGMTDQ